MNYPGPPTLRREGKKQFLLNFQPGIRIIANRGKLQAQLLQALQALLQAKLDMFLEAAPLFFRNSLVRELYQEICQFVRSREFFVPLDDQGAALQQFKASLGNGKN